MNTVQRLIEEIKRATDNPAVQVSPHQTKQLADAIFFVCMDGYDWTDEMCMLFAYAPLEAYAAERCMRQHSGMK